jgi:hypothetical protein
MTLDDAHQVTAALGEVLRAGFDERLTAAASGV